MESKKCPHCQLIINTNDKVCPYCHNLLVPNKERKQKIIFSSTIEVYRKLSLHLKILEIISIVLMPIMIVLTIVLVATTRDYDGRHYSAYFFYCNVWVLVKTIL